MRSDPHGKVLVVLKTAATAAALTAVLLLGTACGNDDASADPSPGPSSSTTVESPTPTDEATDEPTSTVAPATGPLMDIPLASVRAPEGWKILPKIVPGQVDVGNAKDYSFSTIGLSQIVSYDRSLTADQLADQWFDASFYPLDPKKQPLTEIDGVEFFHLAGKVQKRLYLEEFGTQADGKLVTLGFSFSPEVTPEERQEVIDSVLATFQWK